MIRAQEDRAMAGLEFTTERDPLTQPAILVGDNPLLSLGVHEEKASKEALPTSALAGSSHMAGSSSFTFTCALMSQCPGTLISSPS